jgi:hypothetical protein
MTQGERENDQGVVGQRCSVMTTADSKHSCVAAERGMDRGGG